jgi:hypothetical protein
MSQKGLERRSVLKAGAAALGTAASKAAREDLASQGRGLLATTTEAEATSSRRSVPPCQSAPNRDPGSASKRDPTFRRSADAAGSAAPDPPRTASVRCDIRDLADSCEGTTERLISFAYIGHAVDGNLEHYIRSGEVDDYQLKLELIVKAGPDLLPRKVARRLAHS